MQTTFFSLSLSGKKKKTFKCNGILDEYLTAEPQDNECWDLQSYVA